MIRVPRVRFTVRRLMLAVAGAGVVLALIVWMRPQPVRVQIRGSDTWIRWSNGSETMLKPGGMFPNLNGGDRVAGGFLTRVKWIDMDNPSSTSYTWHPTWPSEPPPSAPPD